MNIRTLFLVGILSLFVLAVTGCSSEESVEKGPVKTMGPGVQGPGDNASGAGGGGGAAKADSAPATANTAP